MPTIRPLPPLVVNKIAAGEVIERPASVVKELLENAIDAGATRVEVSIEKGGTDLIRVADDGCGIPPDELPLAVTNHATSKIADADDLFRVGTLGFRGEALASIASVSRLTISSRTHDAQAGAELTVVGGSVGRVEPVGRPAGSTVEVRQLFFNTPVRQKFLRSPQTEVGHAAEAVTRVALAHPGVRVSLRHNGRVLHELPPVEDWRLRIAALFGDELADALLWVESEELGVRLSGYVARPQHFRSNNRSQYLLLNGRAIRDRSLQHALGEAYRGLLLTGRFPVCFLRLDMPPEQVDVNVHPTKLEVRFADSGRLYSQVLGTLRTRFLSADLRAGAPAAWESGVPHQGPGDAAASGPPGSLVEWAQNELSQRRLELRQDAPHLPLRGEPLTLRPFQPFEPLPRATAAEGAAGGPLDPPTTPAGPERWDAPHAGPPGPASRAMQVHNRYLVVETDDGLEVIDQHALHERILYEQVRAKVLAGGLESQRLLVPEPVDLSATEAAAALDHRALLAQLGVGVEPFGGDTVLVTSYPSMLANLAPGEVLRDLVERLLSGGRAPEARDLVDELLHSVACKAAVKYGDRLTPVEIEALLAERPQTENHHHCPHGRPTALRFTCDELDRRFQRM